MNIYNAVSLFRQNKQHIPLLVLDVTLGRESSAEVKECRGSRAGGLVLCRGSSARVKESSAGAEGLMQGARDKCRGSSAGGLMQCRGSKGLMQGARDKCRGCRSMTMQLWVGILSGFTF
ncbi:hypothetical protein DPMN_033706 [Dreissena polymorpha]|uniref:Uncharacterized protein n=1 Tax=Dreissena polymorpha TaxID=45954 RepID=A0A9D4M443_DREPO|nr:hypothetical protein DPMN_033706 [Dreissena polymorpha]